MKRDPIIQFRDWQKEELVKSNLPLPNACCLSTTGLDGYPNARFVSLKDIRHNNFIVTGPLSSRKGLEIQKNPKVALTFWWTFTRRQVRIQGDVALLTAALADQYFEERNREAKVIAKISDQGKPIMNLQSLRDKFLQNLKAQLNRPANWGGFAISPVRIEFMDFKQSRFHERQLFTLTENRWEMTWLQP